MLSRLLPSEIWGVGRRPCLPFSYEIFLDSARVRGRDLSGLWCTASNRLECADDSGHFDANTDGLVALSGNNYLFTFMHHRLTACSIAFFLSYAALTSYANAPAGWGVGQIVTDEESPTASVFLEVNVQCFNDTDETMYVYITDARTFISPAGIPDLLIGFGGWQMVAPHEFVYSAKAVVAQTSTETIDVHNDLVAHWVQAVNDPAFPVWTSDHQVNIGPVTTHVHLIDHAFLECHFSGQYVGDGIWANPFVSWIQTGTQFQTSDGHTDGGTQTVGGDSTSNALTGHLYYTNSLGGNTTNSSVNTAGPAVTITNFYNVQNGGGGGTNGVGGTVNIDIGGNLQSFDTWTDPSTGTGLASSMSGLASALHGSDGLPMGAPNLAPMPSFSQTHTLSWFFPGRGGGLIPFTVDLSRLSLPVSIFRTACLFFISVLFWSQATSIIRDAIH